MASLKYFAEEASEYRIIATGSFMGIALHQGTSFPVGKVDMLQLFPMNYKEFLMALEQDEMCRALIEKDYDFIHMFRTRYIECLRTYYAVGGMPEAVQDYAEHHDFISARDKQRTLLDYYRMDFSKHAEPKLVTRLNQVWNSIPSQLSKENKKFIFGHIAKGARAKDFELALQWLSDCGLVYIVHRLTKPGIPLKAYEELNAYKVFVNDTGLLGALGELPVESVVQGNRMLEEFKGALTEQYVLTQLVSDLKIRPSYYSTDNSRGEIDFIILKDSKIIPIEVKAEENLQAKSLRAFVSKYPDTRGVRISMSDYREQDWMENLPLYAFMAYL